ncbi:MAG TPA: PQQ-dependent sugar dehydrogenase [Burkholderiales bacterium]|nr:PQQ-dependent sugar dehydrogenase [Burkholderiales bacterium]
MKSLAALLTVALLLTPARSAARCAPDNGGLTLPAGFCASVFADNLGQARHLAVAVDGTVYVNTWRSPYREGAKVAPGGFLVALRDADGDGVAELVERFGEDSSGRATGGTGIAIHKGQLYAEESGRIVRYALVLGKLVPRGERDIVVDNLPTKGGHTMHPFVISRDGALFINVGSASNACQVKDRAPHSPGRQPCEELDERAGLWRYDASLPAQLFERGGRYATGLRNAVALAMHPSAGLVVLQHGRDQLHENWPEKFSLQQGAELPAEAMFRIKYGADYGWPYCYYDGREDRHVLAPEYGGDGRETGRCRGLPAPVAAYPAHWAPNALLFYTGSAFPERYRGGAFIAFHGSWNRPQQQGYNLVFQPLDRDGAPSGGFEVFADGFAGPVRTPEGARHRPSGVAMGPDGALYVSDDQRGRVWRIVPGK